MAVEKGFVSGIGGAKPKVSKLRSVSRFGLQKNCLPRKSVLALGESVRCRWQPARLMTSQTCPPTPVFSRPPCEFDHGPPGC